MSRPDRAPGVAVDFAPPRRPSRVRPLAALVVVLLLAGVVTLAATQLLLH